MKHVKMMYLKNCPYCKQALQIIDDLKSCHPEFQKIQIEMIEEHEEPEKTKGLDYWYVPTYFVNGDKIHEGIPTKEALKQVLQSAVNDEDL